MLSFAWKLNCRSVCRLIIVSLLMLTGTAHSAAKTILVLGDSISAEYGLVRGQGWVKLLENKLEANGHTFKVFNASISGETTIGGKSRIQDLLNKHQPQIVIIELGGNDALRGLSLQASKENLLYIVSSAKKANAKVLLTGIQIPPNYGPDYSKSFAAMFKSISKDEKVPLVPFIFEGFADQPAMFQADRIHPTAQAQPIMLGNVWPLLSPLLK